MAEEKATIQEYIQALKASPTLGNQVVFHQANPAMDAQYGRMAKAWPPAIRKLMKKAGLGKLYQHQVRAVGHVRQDRHVVVSTATASGKTLIYNLPFFESVLENPKTRGLYLFPLKALTQDQVKSFQALSGLMPEGGPTAAVYDGDTSGHFRKKIKEDPPNAIFTNPEMLHLAFLPYHRNWAPFFKNLKYVVVDEVHTYRGIMGSNMAWVFRRLLRVCEKYHAKPTFIFCSATIANPRELTQGLTGLDVELVEKSTAPSGAKHVVFLDPTDSAARTAIQLLKAALYRGLRTIVYTQSRKMTELISMWASQRSGRFKGKISAYRAGFLPEERRAIEARLSSGDLLAVVSTSALELGIDIGNLDLCILVGYPGTIMSTWQRSGRVGRDLSDAAMVLVAGEDALDQYFMRNPKDFFERQVESAVINPLNPFIGKKHLECAASEQEISLDDPLLKTPEILSMAKELEAESLLHFHPRAKVYRAVRKNPQREVDLRGAGKQFAIISRKKEKHYVVGQIDGHRAFYETHPGAVYLHRGQTYLVNELDLGTKQAVVEKKKVDFYTRARSSKETEILETQDQKQIAGVKVRLGRLRVTDQVTSYEKRMVRTGKSLGIHPLELPPNVFETQGIWFEIPREVEQEAENSQLHFMGGIHAMEHAAIGILPLLVMTDRNDLGGISTVFHPQVGMGAVFVYDAVPGGVGLCYQAFQNARELLEKTRQVVSSCTCEHGCPSCVHSPKCGSGNRPIDKKASLFVLNSLLKEGAPTPQEKEEQGGLERPPAIHPPQNPKKPKGRKETESVSKTTAKTGSVSVSRKPVSKKTKLHYGVLDIETRKSAAEVGGWHKAHKMGMSCAVLYDSARDDYLDFLQEDADELGEYLSRMDLVIGFNIKRFDYAVLSGLSNFNFSALPTLDLLDEVKNSLGYRLSLDSLATTTLGAEKSASGLLALKWWKEKQLGKILAYCRKDVELTRDLYLFGKEHGYLQFKNKARKTVKVQVNFKR